MARNFALLPRIAKNAARVEAIRAFDQHGDTIDLDTAEVMIESRLRTQVGSMWLDLAVAIAIALIKYWISRRLQNADFYPTAVFVAGEPGAIEPGSDE